MFTVRSGEEQVVGSGKVLLTGISRVKLKAVGSDIDTLTTELGYENAKEGKPAADTSADGNRRVRVDFWLENEKGGVWKESFFVEETEEVTKDGKKEFTNKVGQYATGDAEGNPPTLEWINTDGLRTSYRGESGLVTFIREMANLNNGKHGDELILDFNKLFNGDLSDLKTLPGLFEKNGNGLQVLLLIRIVNGDKGLNYYQSMYRRRYQSDKGYARLYQNASVKIQKSLSESYGAIKDDQTYQNSLELKVFNPTEVRTPVEAVPSTAVAASPWD